MVGKAVATMVCSISKPMVKRGKIEEYLVEGSQKDTTHEARKNYPQTIFREDLTFIRPCIRRRSGFVVFLLHRYNFMRGIRGCGVRARTQGIVRHGMWKIRVLDR